MSGMYTVLASVYGQAQFTLESESLRARLFDKIQSEGWLGRRILELGSGIGETACWFAENGFRVTAVDQSAAMMAEAQNLAEQKNLDIDWRQEDMRTLAAGSGYDLVLSLNTLNEMRSIRDLEAVFRRVNQALDLEKTFVFDLMTIKGFVEKWGNQDYVLYDDPDKLNVIARSRFSFETSANTRAYIVYHSNGEMWQRLDETHVLRGYAMQAVGALLQRSGFKVQSVINPYLEDLDPYNDQTGRAVMIALKEQNLE